MKRIYKFLFFVFISSLILFLPSTVNAQAYRGLVINQFKFYYNDVDPGTTEKGSFTITHDFQDKNKKEILHVIALDFTSDGKTGVPVFIRDEEISTKYSLAKWITFDRTTIELDHYGQSEKINFTINVPNNAQAGGKYAAILLSESATDGSFDTNNDITEFALTKELGPLVFLTVNGNIRREFSFEDLYTRNLDGKKTAFFDFPPIDVVAVLKNNGNVHESPRGVFYIYQGSNFQKYLYSGEMNPDDGTILPESTREFSTTWNESFISFDNEKQPDGSIKKIFKVDWSKISHIRIGKYNVKLLYSYKDASGQYISGEANTVFWVVPWQLLLILLVIILTIYFIISKRSKSKKHEKSS